ncbi:TolB protein [Kordiimonas sediminis]|uniref:TolB protein n=2 Tax=Kordiimonas sediminis TaxID=1735581 RepID=A0A919AT13_9PROT|nr:TolB protein [Kordiimonas sediminis]
MFAANHTAVAADSSWDVSNPPVSVEGTEVAINTSTGTWMSLDVSPDGKWIAFDMLGDIYKLPMNGGKAENITQGVSWDMQPRFSPDGKTLAFTSDRAGGNNIWTLDLETGTYKQVTKETFRLLNNPTWSPDGNFIAARKHFTTTRSNGTGEIWMYHKDGGKGLQVIKRPNEQYQKELGEPMFTPDGNSLYFVQNVTPGNTFIYAEDSNTELYQIKSVDLADGSVSVVAGGPGGAVRPTPSPDGKYLAYVKRVRAKSRLFLKDLETGSENMIHDDMDRDFQEGWAVQGVYPNMDWTPDSENIVFWSRGKIWKISAKSRQVTNIPFSVEDTRTVYAPPRPKVDVAPDTFDTKIPRFATPSPSGDAIVYETLGKLYVKRGDDTPVRLTRDSGDHFELFPTWSPDGKYVYFTTWDDVELGTIRRVSAKGGKSKQLNKDKGHYADLSLSSDGDTLLYRKRKGGGFLNPDHGLNPGIYTMPASGGTPVFITADGTNPAFMKNGRISIFQGGYSGSKLYSVSPEGHDKREIASTGLGTDIKLSPDGKHIAWVENYQVYVSPYAATGKSQALTPSGSALPLRRLSKNGGLYMGWNKDGTAVHWSIGPDFKSVAIKEAFADGFTAPDSGINLSVKAKHDKPSGITALTGVRIVTMNGALDVIEDGVIIIDGNRIKAVGPTSQTAIPNGAKIVRLEGKTIIPGLIDIHAHGGYGTGEIVPQQNWNQQAHLALGVTTTHNPSSRAKLVFPAAEYAKSGLTLTPRIFSTAEIIYGARSALYAPVNDIDEALTHVRRLKAQGAISVKNYNQPRRNQRQQIVEAARRENMIVVAEGSALYHLGMSHVIDGNTGVEHTLPNTHIYDDILQLWPQTQVGFTPTLAVAFGGLPAENYWYQHTDVWKHPILSQFVPPTVLQSRSVRRPMAPEEDYVDNLNAAFAKDLMRKGVMVNIGAHGQREGLAAHWEMWSFARGGMTPMEALKTATINPALYFGMEADLGSVEAGKLADLVILNVNPLDDIYQTDKVSHVMLNGRLYDPKTLNEVETGSYKNKPYYWHGKPESEIR